MKLPEYITANEVKRVCTEIGLRDWSEIMEPIVSQEEATTILEIVNTCEIGDVRDWGRIKLLNLIDIFRYIIRVSCRENHE